MRNIWLTKSPQQIQEASEHSQLKKNLTAFDLAALGIGSVVGTGIFVATGQGAKLTGGDVRVLTMMVNTDIIHLCTS